MKPCLRTLAILAILGGQSAYAEIIINFDTLANGSIVTDQFRENGVVFESLTVVAEGTSGVDGAASAPNTVVPSRVSASIFDGKSAADIASQYGISQQQGYGESYTDVFFVLDGTNIPSVTNSVSILAGFDFLDLSPNEVNRMVLEAFDSNFNLIGFVVSPRLDSATPTELSIVASGIRGVRITQSDGVTFDNFRFNTTSIPEPGSFGLALAAMCILGYRRVRERS